MYPPPPLRSMASLTLVLASCATTGSAGLAMRETGPEVVEVRIHGNEALPDSRIEDRIATRATNRFLFFGGEHHLEPGALTQDVHRIEDLYEEEGYYAAMAWAQVRELGDEKVRIDFHVVEGPPTIVRSLLVVGLDDLPPEVRARVLEEPALVRGDRLVEASYEAMKGQILRRLAARGYAAVELEALAEVSPERGTADLVFEVEPGDRYHFGEITVEGNLLIPERKVKEAARVVLWPGAPYSPYRLADAEQEIFSLGVFASSVAVGQEPDPDTLEVPVRLFVSEADFLRLRVGAGAGIEQGLEQIRAVADFAHLNLFGGMQRLTLHNEVAYRVVLGEARSGIAGRAVAELTQPDLIRTRIDVALRFGYERQFTQSFTSESIAARIGAPIRFRRWLYLTPSYNLERYFHVSVFDEESLAVQEANRRTPLVNCPQGCTFSYLEQRLIADRRSNPMEPRAGWYASIGLQEGGSVLGGDFTWIRFVPEGRHYVSLSNDVILATRLELGFLQPLGDQDGCSRSPDVYSQQVRCSPIVVRFFGGGAGGFRGVGAGRLSPLRVVEEDRGGRRRELFIPQGGNSSFLGTLELRWLFAENWSSAFFIDAANVAAGALEAFELATMHYAAGAGIRYRTPIGPARLDVGYRFLRRHLEVINDDAVVEKRLIDWFGVFISIGEAF